MNLMTTVLFLNKSLIWNKSKKPLGTKFVIFLSEVQESSFGSNGGWQNESKVCSLIEFYSSSPKLTLSLHFLFESQHFIFNLSPIINKNQQNLIKLAV